MIMERKLFFLKDHKVFKNVYICIWYLHYIYNIKNTFIFLETGYNHFWFNQW